jgi:hypothetical protein
MKVRTYLSHSYRLRDQPVNQTIWAALAEKGFVFFVDPPSSFHQTAHLEKQMLESSCFVAIVPFRRDAPRFHCSPFILYEIGLAIQAKRPKLVLIDDEIPDDTLLFSNMDAEERVRFNPENIDAIKDELEFKLKRLHGRALPEAMVVHPPKRRIGLVLGNGELALSHTAHATICAAVDAYSFSLYPINTQHRHNALLLQQIDACDAVILDCRAATPTNWIIAYLLARPVPTIKLVPVDAAKQLCDICLHPVVDGTKMDECEPFPEHLLFWRVEEELYNQLIDILERLHGRPAALGKWETGEKYFQTIGRRKARIFVSNSGSQRELGADFSRLLSESNIEFFHYKIDIKSGDGWKSRIRQELQECDGLVAFIDTDYLEREWCMEELRVALARKRNQDVDFLFRPFNIGSADVEVLGDINAADLDPNDSEALRLIVADIDAWLKRGVDVERQRGRSLVPGGTREWLIDLIRQLPEGRLRALQEEFDINVEDVGDGRAWAASDHRGALLSRRLAIRVLEALVRDDTPFVGNLSNEHPLIMFCMQLENSGTEDFGASVRALTERLRRITIDE